MSDLGSVLSVSVAGPFVGATMAEVEQQAARILSPQQLTELLSGVDVPEGDVNRRNKDRRGFSRPVVFVPISANGKPSPDQAVMATGKDISEAGLGFVHPRPLPSKRGIVCFEHPKAGKFAIEVAVLWTQLDSAGVYESGCRMLRKAVDRAPGGS